MTETAGPLLTVATSEDGGALVLALTGELDPHTAPILDEHVRRALEGPSPTVVLDLVDLTFIDSSGLRSVIAAHKALVERGGHLVLRSPGPTTRRLLDVTGLTDQLEVEA